MERECQDWVAQALAAWRTRRAPEALGELLKSQRNRAYSIALRITASPADAEDAVQDAFLKLLSRTQGLDDQEAFELSVYRAVVQCALDALRKKRRRQTREAGNASGQTTGESSVSGQHHEPEALAAEEETRALLHAAVAELSDDERVPVVLCYYQGLSVVQTAKTLDIPRETIRARLTRALERLRQALTRNNKELSAAVIVTLLWRDGHLMAPASLCSALDTLLPGKACSAVPLAAQAGPAQTAALSAAKAGLGLSVKAAATLLTVALVGGGAATLGARHVSPTQLTPAAIADLGPSTPDAPRPQPGSADLKKEDDPVKSKLAAMVLAGGMLLPAAAQAAEPNPQVADAIAQIAARRAEKVAANEAAAQAQAKAEGRERGWNRLANPQAGGAPGGATKR